MLSSAVFSHHVGQQISKALMPGFIYLWSSSSSLPSSLLGAILVSRQRKKPYSVAVNRDAVLIFSCGLYLHAETAASLPAMAHHQREREREGKHFTHSGYRITDTDNQTPGHLSSVSVRTLPPLEGFICIKPTKKSVSWVLGWESEQRGCLEYECEFEDAAHPFRKGLLSICCYSLEFQWSKSSEYDSGKPAMHCIILHIILHIIHITYFIKY